MTGAEIEEVIAGFAQTARIAVEAGIDGVELHGTHGYLLQQSFSPWGNQRDDELGRAARLRPGGDRAGCGEAIGRDPALGLRISTDDFLRPGARRPRAGRPPRRRGRARRHAARSTT